MITMIIYFLISWSYYLYNRNMQYFMKEPYTYNGVNIKFMDKLLFYMPKKYKVYKSNMYYFMVLFNFLSLSFISDKLNLPKNVLIVFSFFTSNTMVLFNKLFKTSLFGYNEFKLVHDISLINIFVIPIIIILVLLIMIPLIALIKVLFTETIVRFVNNLSNDYMYDLTGLEKKEFAEYSKIEQILKDIVENTPENDGTKETIKLLVDNFSTEIYKNYLEYENLINDLSYNHDYYLKQRKQTNYSDIFDYKIVSDKLKIDIVSIKKEENLKDKLGISYNSFVSDIHKYYLTILFLNGNLKDINKTNIELKTKEEFIKEIICYKNKQLGEVII